LWVSQEKSVKNVMTTIAVITFFKCSSIFMLYNGASRYTRKFGALLSECSKATWRLAETRGGLWGKLSYWRNEVRFIGSSLKVNFLFWDDISPVLPYKLTYLQLDIARVFSRGFMHEDMSEARKIFLVARAKPVARYLKYCWTWKIG
jgi:hypothetical protein